MSEVSDFGILRNPLFFDTDEVTDMAWYRSLLYNNSWWLEPLKGNDIERVIKSHQYALLLRNYGIIFS